MRSIVQFRKSEHKSKESGVNNMVMKALRDGASGGITKFFLLGFMTLAVGGLVLTDVGGFFRGGVSGSDVARVGNETLDIRAFDRTLRQSVRAVGLTPEDAYRFGYLNQVLGQELRSMLLQQAAENHGILISDQRAAKQIETMVSPLVRSGQSVQEVFSQVLRAQGMSEGAFVKSIKRDIGNNMLQTMISSNFEHLSPDLVADMYRYEHEKRSVRFVEFYDDKFTDVEEPSEDELRQFYDATKEAYAREETRLVKILQLDTKQLEDTLEVSDEDVKHYYETHVSYYELPASWAVEQALVSKEDQAKQIYQAVKDGALLGEAVEDITANKTGYLAKRDMRKDDIIADLQEAILAVEENGTLLEPMKSPLGWHVIRVVSVNPARIKSLDEVKDQIRGEIKSDQLIDHIYEQVNMMDDLFAGGASVDEVMAQMDVRAVTLPPMNQFGLDEDGSDALGKVSAGREQIVEHAFEMLEGETSAVLEDTKGQFFAVHLMQVTPKSYRSFEEVKAALETRWINDQKRVKNKEKVSEALAQKKPLDELAKEYGFAIKTKKLIARKDAAENPFVPATLSSLFAAPLHKQVLVDIQGGSAILEVTDFEWPEVDPDSVEYRSFEVGLQQAAKQEALGAYIQYQQDKTNVVVNDRLIDQMYGSTDQQGY